MRKIVDLWMSLIVSECNLIDSDRHLCHFRSVHNLHNDRPFSIILQTQKKKNFEIFCSSSTVLLFLL